MTFPSDIRYANRIWMSMVLITPIFHNFLLILFGKIPIDVIVTGYVQTIFSSGITLIIYWAILMILVLAVNSSNYSISMKKWIIQGIDIACISLFFGVLMIFIGINVNLNLLLLILSYVVVSSSAIWFFKLEPRTKTDDFEIIEHLIE